MSSTDDNGSQPSGQFSIIIPACIQERSLLEIFRENLRTFRHDAIGRFYVLCNRLTVMSESTLEAMLQAEVEASIQVIADKERSVAGAWNRGIQLSDTDGFTQYLITAVDVSVTPKTIDALLDYGTADPGCDIWSSTPTSEDIDDSQMMRDWHDFSCLMLRRGTIHKHGWFDREYKPAYFEDNDYATRVVLGGGRMKQLFSARHEHFTSLTIKKDSEMARHVAHWYDINHGRFHRKWGHKSDDVDEVKSRCHPTPLDSGKPLHWWPEQDEVECYNPGGGIHE
ncbi:MAG: hypothetical protein AAF711_13645 [Planctomycetota bacterium]